MSGRRTLILDVDADRVTDAMELVGRIDSFAHQALKESDATKYGRPISLSTSVSMPRRRGKKKDDKP
jgi:hypothetical protein